MKVIRFDAFPDSNARLVTDSFFTDNAIIMSDSTWRPHRRPLFFPAEGFWLCDIRLAIKIGRLGKAIEEKFASRYYEEFCLVNFLVREPDPELFTTPDCMIDDALIHGEWLPITSAPLDIEIRGYKGASTDEEPISKKIELPVEYINRALKALSHESTFKTGDIIVLPKSILRYSPKLDSHIKATVNGTMALDFKIK